MEFIPNTVLTAEQLNTEFGKKVDKVEGKGLSSEDFTSSYKSKLDNLKAVATSGDYDDLTGKPAFAAVATSGDYDDLTGKPAFAAVATSGDYNDLTGKPAFAAVATSGSYNDLSNRPSIPAAQVNSDWNATSGIAQILNKPTIPTLAPLADTADIASLSGSDTVTPGALGTAAAAAGTISGGASPSFNWSAAVNYTMTLTGNRTLPNPTNVLPGTTRVIVVSSSTSTTRTLAFGSNFVGNLPTVSVTNTSHMVLFLYAISATKIVVTGVAI